MILKTFGVVVLLGVCLFQTVYAQISVEEVVNRADLQRRNYEATFKNIFAEETKTFRGFNRDGSLKKLYQVESNFLVFQSNKNAEVITEYRNVIKFDGKKVATNDEKSERFFTELLRSRSVNDELTKIKFQSAKYDRDLMVSDLTLRQSPVLAEHIRPYFDFKIVGVDDGKHIIHYQQVRPSPFVLVNDFESTETRLTMDFGIILPPRIRETNARVRGKLWIDTVTFQVWGEERELTIQPEKTENPIVVFQLNFEFGKEGSQILLPKKITLISFLLRLQKNQLFTIKDAQLDFEYNGFSEVGVSVKSSGILEPIVVERRP